MIFNGPELVTIEFKGCPTREVAWTVVIDALKEYLSESESIDFGADVKVEKFISHLDGRGAYMGEVVFSVN